MYNTKTGPEIGDFQNNGNLGHAANLGMTFMDRVLVTEDML